jgi:hypothetical protein
VSQAAGKGVHAARCRLGARMKQSISVLFGAIAILASPLLLAQGADPSRAHASACPHPVFGVPCHPEKFDFQNQGPVEFLDFLRTAGSPYVLTHSHGDWLRRGDIALLLPLADSKEPCARIVTSTPGYVPIERSTVGNEALFLLDAIRRGVFPASIYSPNHDSKRRAEILNWARQQIPQHQAPAADKIPDGLFIDLGSVPQSADRARPIEAQPNVPDFDFASNSFQSLYFLFNSGAWTDLTREDLDHPSGEISIDLGDPLQMVVIYSALHLPSVYPMEDLRLNGLRKHVLQTALACNFDWPAEYTVPRFVVLVQKRNRAWALVAEMADGYLIEDQSEFCFHKLATP